MTNYSDDFSVSLDRTKWMLRPHSTPSFEHVAFVAGYQALSASSASEFITYNDGVAVTITDPAAGDVFAVTGTLDPTWVVDSEVICYCDSSSITNVVSSTNYIAKIVAGGLELYDDAGDVIVGAQSIGLTAVLYVQELIADKEQRHRAVVHSVAESSTSYTIMWNRFDPKRSAAAQTVGFLYGYGCKLTWNSGGTRTLSFVKVDPSTHVLFELATVDVTLVDSDDSDLGVGQLITFDTISPSGSGEAGYTVLNAYLNTLDDSEPTLTFTDVGGMQGVFPSPPGNERPGTFGFTFGAAGTIYLDSWEGTDNFEFFTKAKPEGRTLLELRTSIKTQLANGGNTSYPDSFVDDYINDAISEVLDELGDKNEYQRAIKTLTLTVDSNYLVAMPHYMDRIIAIYDGETHASVMWRLVSRNENDQLSIYLQDQPSGLSYQVSYIKRWEPLVDDSDICPVPRRWDDVVRMGVLLRIGGESDRDAAYERSYEKRYMRRLAQLKRAATRGNRQRKPVMSVRTRSPLFFNPSNWGTH